MVRQVATELSTNKPLFYGRINNCGIMSNSEVALSELTNARAEYPGE